LGYKLREFNIIFLKNAKVDEDKDAEIESPQISTGNSAVDEPDGQVV